MPPRCFFPLIFDIAWKKKKTKTSIKIYLSKKKPKKFQQNPCGFTLLTTVFHHTTILLNIIIITFGLHKPPIARAEVLKEWHTHTTKKGESEFNKHPLSLLCPGGGKPEASSPLQAAWGGLHVSTLFLPPHLETPWGTPSSWDGTAQLLWRSMEGKGRKEGRSYRPWRGWGRTSIWQFMSFPSIVLPWRLDLAGGVKLSLRRSTEEIYRAGEWLETNW